MKVSPAVMQEVKRIVEKSEICKEDDAHWPEPNDEGRQELEVIMNGTHVFFTVRKEGSLHSSARQSTRWWISRRARTPKDCAHSTI